MRVIGTAGHVDHGKSTLVQALTGIHPDRLKEEQEREMTIDLGFAWLNLPRSELLPEGEEVGIVDVPGHRDFIENMLSGVGGIDAALFVIAADEGVMPQTREHLAILNILQIGDGVVALTKIDLVEDLEWLNLVEEDIHKTLRGTVLERAPIIRVSSRTHEGIPELTQALGDCLARCPLRPDLSRPRLPVDRIFTMSGFGTVVTGTLLDGRLHVGDEVELLGSSSENLRGRVRGLQTHKQKEDVAVPGSRTAVNISGVDVDQIRRGDVLAHPGDYHQTRRMDVQFCLLPEASQPLSHNTEAKFFIGAAEVVARLRLLGVEELLPGKETWLQLETSNPVVALRGDRYILRRPSPGETLGGGVVIDPHPKSRHKRFSSQVLTRLEALTKGTPAEVLMQSLLVLGAASLQEVILHSNLDPVSAKQAIEELSTNRRILALGEGNKVDPSQSQLLVTSKEYWDHQTERAIQELDAYHRTYPLRRGELREEFKSRLRLPARLFNVALRKWAQDGVLVENGPILFRSGHSIQFDSQQRRLSENLMAMFDASPYAPPSIKDCITEIGEELYYALVDLRELQPVSSEVVFRRKDFDKMVEDLTGLLKKQEIITAAEVRDHFKTSRRYILAFLEFLDSTGITIRDGDIRRLKKPAAG